MTALKLAFMGTPDFAVPTLAALIEADHEIAAVYTRPAKPAGRGQHIAKTPVQKLAERHDLTVRAPSNFKDKKDVEDFAALDLDAAVVVAYGVILPPRVLEAPRLGCINIHASLLPRWRGAAPIQRAIMAGDKEAGVTIMMIEQALDAGPVLLDRRVPITPRATAGSLHDALAAISAPALMAALDGLASGTLKPRAQPEDGVIYAHKIGKSEARIDWSRPSIEVDRMVRGLSPHPGAFFEVQGERIQVLDSEAVSDGAAGAPGEVLDDGLLVACGEGAVRLLEVKRAGKGAMSARDMLRGFPIAPGARLG